MMFRRLSTVARLPLLGLSLLAVAACTGQPTRDAPDAAAPEDSQADSALIAREAAVARSEREELLAPALRDATRETLRRALGNPDSTAAEAVPNRHMPGVTDTIFTMGYGELVATVHTPGGGGDLLSSVVVRDNRHLRFPAIGLTADEIQRAFGEPTARSGDSLRYDCLGCGEMEQPVEFFLSGGRVDRVRLSYYVD